MFQRAFWPFVVFLQRISVLALVLNIVGRIMSFSSWLRMWQCHTYSCPKLVI